ncbi:serine/threonine-protein kinase/endoribonuclease IRE1b-like isoform X2 [Xenia sp. Carnegie-2017]|uniref:serine/threonine-protein kinase/endoribonuclease IRE1b-like isoform X2 n=1 Tax=Xenia sp. Carnegie-2017 TaxID=2897299 RepID=UPI001F0342EE|nr:serine/threonine-protein kinase/endoribonuclease IRE1b-like isoform X2 [Xenia sp. Carnegie-2017]
MDTQVSVRNFLVEIMSQLVYNIVNKADNVVNYSDLYHRFKQKTGFEMEEFLDLYGNDVSEDDLMDVIRDIPGLKFDEDDDIYVVDDGSSSCSHSKKLSQHRGKILISCAKLLIYKDETDDINKCFDESRNTALHILITLPGISDDRNLLKNLFNAGVNPFAVNEEDIKKNVIKENYIIQAIDILRKYNVDYDGDGCTVKDKINGFKETSPTLYKKCVELLFSKIDASNDNNDSPLAEWRKLRSCPPRHTHSANRLMNENGPTITVVGKFRYFLEEPIGFGAFSSIYVAIKDEQFNEESGTMQCRPFALKRIDKAKINPEEIKRETTALISLSGKCENIIRYHDSLEDTFFQYLVLDLMDGDLNEFVGNREASVVLGNGVEAVKQIINGLAFLHENGYIHRDLKPGNILYTRYPRLDFKISDFGLAKNISASSTMMSTRGNPFSTAAGSRCWMAPELVSMKSSEHTKQSDIFSLGLILHYLMSFGKHPFATPGDERPHVVERNIEEMNGNLKNDLHPEAKSFLLTLLNVEPSNRPTAAHLNKHSYPFLWSVHKKIEFLKAVGDQNEARNPAKYPNSELEELLEKTQTCEFIPWDEEIKDLYEEMTEAWSQKKYREDKVIDLVRFIRNAYAHREERSVDLQEQLENSVFLFKFPPLVVDVFDVVQQAGLHSRSAIKVALES